MERFCAPLDDSSASNRAYIAEYAFSLFVERMKDKIECLHRQPIELRNEAKAQAERRLRPYGAKGLRITGEFDEKEALQVSSLEAALFDFFSTRMNNLILRPVFAGCGFIDKSEGDVLAGDILFEVKTVDRRVRGKDIRQLITYAALNMASKQYTIDKLGLVNPRRGQYCLFSINEVCNRIAGVPAPELLAQIVEAVSSDGVSR